MFCPYCGKQNDSDAIFCAFCGKKIEDTQPNSISLLRFLFSWGGVIWKQKILPVVKIVGKYLRKHIRIFSGGVSAVIVVVFLVSVLGSFTGPKNIAKRFFENYMDADWTAVYHQLYLPESPLLNEESFLNSFEPSVYSSEYLNYTLQQEETTSNEDLYLRYTVEYSTPNRSTSSNMQITLVNGGKQFLFFDKYYIVLDELFAENCTVEIPDGAQLLVDGIPVDTQLNASGETVLPTLFSGTHTLSLEHPVYQSDPASVYLSSGSTVNMFSECQVDKTSLQNPTFGDVTGYVQTIFNTAISDGDLIMSGIPLSNQIDATFEDDMDDFQKEVQYRQNTKDVINLDSVGIDEAYLVSSEGTVECRIILNCSDEEGDTWESGGLVRVSYMDGQWQLVGFDINI